MSIRSRPASLAAALASWLLVAAACTSSSTNPVVVLAASSTAPTVEAVADGLGLDAAVTGAGSPVLVAQVRAGAPADVVLLADLDLANELVDEGLSAPRAWVTSGLSLVGRPGLGRMSVTDALADASLRIVLADEGVPLGDATREAFAAEAITLPRERVVSLEDSAASVLGKVASGAADLAVVYTANAATAVTLGRAVLLGSLAADRVQVTTWIQFATPEGEAFADALRSSRARTIVESAGFLFAPTDDDSER